MPVISNCLVIIGNCSYNDCKNLSTKTKTKTREHRIQRITFAAKTNGACIRGSADTQTHTLTDTHIDAKRHNTFAG